MDRNLQIIGLARKAGLLAVGADDVSKALRTGKAWLVISAGDASEAALRRACKGAEYSGVTYTVVPHSSFELGSITGRGSPGTAAILDAGLAARFMRGLADTDPERYRDTADILTQKAVAEAEKKRRAPSGKRRILQ